MVKPFFLTGYSLNYCPEFGVHYRSNFKGVTSPDYRVFSLIDNSYCADYYMRLCQVGYIEKIFYAYGQGVSHFGRWRFTTENFKEFIFPIPPKVEQEAIAKFLEKETNRVTTLIKKKSRFLDLLKEKRQTMVDEAIKHLKTEVLHIQHCCTQVYRSVKRQDDEIYTPIGLYNRGRGIFHKEPTLGRNLGDSDFSYIKEGDLILSGQFSWEGAVALAGNIENDCIASHRYHIFRGKNHLLDTNYFWAYLTTKEGDFLLNENSRGSAGRNRPLNPNTLIKEKIPVPPIEEQLKIAKLVEKERKLKLAVDKSINLLKEHRTALITAAVTGQIDLREYAHDQTK